MDNNAGSPKAKHFQSNTQISSCFCPSSSSSSFLLILDKMCKTLHSRKKCPTWWHLTGLRVRLGKAALCIEHTSKPTIKSRLNSHLRGMNTKRYWVLVSFTTRTTESCRQCAIELHITARTTSSGNNMDTQSQARGPSTPCYNLGPDLQSSFSTQPCKLIWELHMGPCFSAPSPPK